MQQQNNSYAVILHLSGLAGYFIPLGGIIVPLVLWMLKKDEDPFIDRTGRAVLNFQFSALIYFIVCVVLAFVLIGFLLMPLLLLLEVIFAIIGAVKAGDGIVWQYPMAIPFLS